MGQNWPQTLWLVRHGQSAGSHVARDGAQAPALHSIDAVIRDIDRPLSALGERQARALGRWFRDLLAGERPTVVLSSPYLRARATTLLVLETAKLGAGRDLFTADERLREREFGVLDRLTRLAIVERHPELAEQRSQLGKFYFRPPGGESWCDVILRLRSLVDTVVRDHSGGRVLIVSHQVVINCLRYLLERMDERQILQVDRAGDVPNCSVTSYEFDPARGQQGELVPRLINFVAPLEVTGTPVTAEPDYPRAARS